MSSTRRRQPLDLDLPPAQAQALARLALATAQACGPGLFDRLVRELAAALEVPLVLLAVVTQEATCCARWRSAWTGRSVPTSTSPPARWRGQQQSRSSRPSR